MPPNFLRQVIESGIGNGVLTAEFPGRNPGFGLAENTDDLFVGKTLLHRNALTLLMKTLLASWYIRAGQPLYVQSIQEDNQTSINDEVSFLYNVILNFPIHEII